jgi:phosphotransferase system  glucose/maltose/N-acetylglucosamine-specific IIC component
MYLPMGAIYGLSTGVVVALVLLTLVELGLLVWAVLDIVQRPAVLWGQKWIWLVIVVLFGIIGPLVYFAIGRTQPPVSEKEADEAPVTDRASHAADLLYGPRPQQPPDDGPSRG